MGTFFQEAPARTTRQLSVGDLNQPLSQWNIQPINPSPQQRLYDLPEWTPPNPANPNKQLNIRRADESPIVSETAQNEPEDPTSVEHESPSETDVPPIEPPIGLPQSISEKDAVLLSYSNEIDAVASFLAAELSVLVVCDKLVVSHLWETIARKAGKHPIELTIPDEEGGEGMMQGNLRQRQLAALKRLITDLKEGDVLVIPHLDLLAGGSDANLSTESRETIELVYKQSDRLILAFCDRSQEIPEVLAGRFAARLSITGVPRIVVYPNGEKKPLGAALVTASEAAHFDGFDPEELYKKVAGMNPIRLRQAIRYAVSKYKDKGRVKVDKLFQAIIAFKAQTSIKFEVPKVSFDQIGGYQSVRDELQKAIGLMAGAGDLPNEELRSELIPRGFIFYGPPGTGKTLFAKAIASELNATIQVVSGPEITDMYVGESERKIRELFSEARRNAPAVLVFDEFDSIATKRSGRDDGGSRAGNAIVAQMLTEMDGFRPDVPILVIGTTNRLDIIDEALLRPSRFKPIAIGQPDIEAREEIARVHAKHFNVEHNLSPELFTLFAEMTDGMSGDDIRSIFRDACVGQYCDKPSKEVNAERLGELVGLHFQAREKRSASSNRERRSAMEGLQPTQMPRPSGQMLMLISEDQQNAATSDVPESIAIEEEISLEETS